MAKFSIGTFRQYDGHLRQRLTKLNMVGLRTNNSIDNELWSLLEYYSEVTEVGHEFLKEKYDSRSIKKAYIGFRSLCRQAKNYYNTAKKTNYRSSALLYYYCFLNLAKALLIVNGKDYSGLRVHHGLSTTLGANQSLSREYVKLTSGVFLELYSQVTGKTLSIGSKFSIHKLLSYCLDISYQYRLIGKGDQKVTYGYYLMCVDRKKKTCWNLLAINGGDVISKYPKTFKGALTKFEVVKMPEHSFRNTFNLQKKNMDSFLIIQSKEVKNWLSSTNVDLFRLKNEIFDDFNNRIQPNLHSDDHDFYLSIPYSKKNQVLITEALSIYLVMYYLSELVRYNTYRLDKLLDRKESWVIQSFIESSPETFLKYLISQITKKNYVFERR